MKISDQTNSVDGREDGLNLPTPATREIWNQEYSRTQAIPSSDRDTPSRALLEAAEKLNLQSVDRAIDLGCGNGRNAEYLANQGIEVLAVDFAKEAIKRTQERVMNSSKEREVSILCCDVTNGIPFETNTVDLVIDSYLSCHFFNESRLKDYFAEVRRVLRTGGQCYWSGLGSSDEYYHSISDSHPAENTVVDPLNGIAKRLYDEDKLGVQIPFGTSPVATSEVVFEDNVDRDPYQRSVVWGVFEKE